VAILCLDCSDNYQLARAYVKFLRNGGLMFRDATPMRLGQVVALQCDLPRGQFQVISARVIRVLPGPLYGMELLPSPQRDAFMEVARQCAEELLPPRVGVHSGPQKVPMEEFEDTMLEVGEDAAAAALLLEEAGVPEDTIDWDKVLAEDVEQWGFEFSSEFAVDDSPDSPADEEDGEKFRQEATRVAGPGRARPEFYLPPGVDPRTLPDADKKRLAIGGDERARRMLAMDSDPEIHLWLLRNPQLTAAEVVNLASSSDLTDETVEFILTRRKWCLNLQVLHSLLYNPAVPFDVMDKMLRLLPDSILEQLFGTDDGDDAFWFSASEEE